MLWLNALFVIAGRKIRLTITSPSGMYNGMLIQDLDIADVSSERRNPILANVMGQLDYMEKRGSGLTRICNETKALDGYRDELKPVFKSTPTQFQTIIFASINMINVGDNDGDVSEMKITERQQNILNLIKESPTIELGAKNIDWLHEMYDAVWHQLEETNDVEHQTEES